MSTPRTLVGTLALKRTVAGVEYTAQVHENEDGFWMTLHTRHTRGDMWDSGFAKLVAEAKTDAFAEARENMMAIIKDYLTESIEVSTP